VKTDWIVFDLNTHEMYCDRCKERYSLPMRLDLVIGFTKTFIAVHKRCRAVEQSPKTDERLSTHSITLSRPNIAELSRRGSVIGSWLLDLKAMALAEDPALGKFTVQDSGE
jgi:hypothetical protein